MPALLYLAFFLPGVSDSHLDSLFQNVKSLENDGQFELALENAFHGLEQSREASDSAFQARFSIRVGTILSIVDRNNEALKYYQEALQISTAVQDVELAGQSLLGIAVIFHLDNTYDSAIAYYGKSLGFLLDAGDTVNYNGTLSNMALIFGDLGDKQRARDLFETSILNRIENNDFQGLAGSYSNMGRMYLLMEEELQSIPYFLKSLSISEANGLSIDTRIAHAGLVKAYLGVGQLDSVSYHFDSYDSLMLDWIHADYGDRLLELETKFKTSEIEKENAVKQLQIEQQQQAQLIMGGVIVFLLLGAIGLYIYNEQRKRSLLAIADRDKQLHSQQIEELLNQEEIKTTYALLDGQEKERKRIAQELHDNISSTMATLNMFLSSFKPSQLDQKESELLERINEVAFQTAEDTRSLSHSLDSGSLSHFGLEVAIRDLLDAVEKSGLQIESSVSIENALPGELAMNTYRILQELVNNTLKHAKASSINLEVNEIPEEYLSVIYSDDGVGFDDKTVVNGIGLKNIRSRVDGLDAQLTIDSKPEKHTTFILEIPLS